MNEKITLCGDDCSLCPRYNAHNHDEYRRVAELWKRVGWRDSIATDDEIRCEGCSPDKECTYHLLECTRKHGIEKCRQCHEFPCDKIDQMLERSEVYHEKCKALCTADELDSLEKAFFNKKENLLK